MKTKILFIFPLLFASLQFFGQGINITSNASIKASGAAIIVVNNGGLINNGSYSKGSETINFSGTTAKTISGSNNTDINNLLITNAAGITTQIGLLSANTFTIASGSKFTIDPAKAFTAAGPSVLGSAQCLVLKSDASGTASFKDNGTINGVGTALIERYLEPYAVVTDLKFHFLSSPVGSAQPIQNEFVNLGSNDITDFYKWDEATNYWINFRSSTYNVRNESFGDGFNFATGKGYLVAYPAAVSKKFVGVPYTNGSGLVIACTNTVGGGWNLLGNPFPSSLDWTGIAKGNGIDAALYYYDNATPGYKYYIDYSGGLGEAAQFIAPMQGFMVHAKTNGTKTVTISNTARTHAGQNVFYKNATILPNVLDLKVEGNDRTDYTRVCFSGYATENFDGDYDAYKLFSYGESASELYSLTNDSTPLAINTLPLSVLEGGTIPVNFTAGLTGNYTMTAEKMNTFAPETYITLEDKATGKFQCMNENPEYFFSASPQDSPGRFVLHFQETNGISDPGVASDFNVFAQDGIINIRSTKQLNGKATVTDMTGRTIAASDLISGLPLLISMHGHPGIYIVSITTADGIMSDKIFIK